MQPTLPNVLGVLSLVFWALMLVICVKYLVFVLRADNQRRGRHPRARRAGRRPRQARGARASSASRSCSALFGAGLLFGDGAITPAISVLGAIEGLSEQSPALAHLVVPDHRRRSWSALFLVQRYGTGRIGIAFGPVHADLVRRDRRDRPALDRRAPGRARGASTRCTAYVSSPSNGTHGFLMLGLVFLVVTGGEALYADMGHFGKRPIRVAWFTVALPALLLNYFGQGALLLVAAAAAGHEPVLRALARGPAADPDARARDARRRSSRRRR